MEARSKRLLYSYSILLVFGLFMFTVLFFAIHGTKAKWYSGLKETVQYVLDKDSSQEFKVDSVLKLNSVHSVSAAAFSLNKKDYFAVIIRIPTMYGPYPAVYVYQRGIGSSFAGMALVSGAMEKQFQKDIASTNAQIEYWNKRIPKMLESALNAREHSNEKQ